MKDDIRTDILPTKGQKKNRRANSSNACRWQTCYIQTRKALL